MSTTNILPPIEALEAAANELATIAQNAGDQAGANALNKAINHLLNGLTITPTVGGFLVPSGTRGGVIHRVSTVYGCNCEAAHKGRQCWHAAAIEIAEYAGQHYTMPALNSDRPSYAESIAAMLECF